MAGTETDMDPVRIRRERDLYLRLLNLAARDDVEQFLAEALQLVVEISGAERGYIELRDEPTDREWSMARGCSSEEVATIRKHISRGIIAEAIATGSTIITHSAMLDDRFSDRQSIQSAKIEAVLCAPIGGHSGLGAVYLQGRTEPGMFSTEDRELAERLAFHLAPQADRILVKQRVAASDDALATLRGRYRLDGIIGRSKALADALEQAMLAAPLDVNVMLTGESGTGKSQLARAIHDNSRRASGPYVELNCASIPTSLLESELFGALKGSHSEARRDTVGKVAAAEGGTLFLDEIAELDYEAQAKLLQVLQSREYYPLGGTTPIKADIRLVAATNTDLKAAVAEKKFREDLYFRLQVLPVHLPRLADRSGDLPDLAAHLVVTVSERHGFDPLPLSDVAMRAIRVAEWPGNVRELANALEAATIRAAGAGATEISLSHVFPQADAPTVEQAATRSFQEATRAFQRKLLLEVLTETGWNVSDAARRLELARSHLYNLISSLQLKDEKPD